MDFMEWLKVTEENDIRVYDAIDILLNGGRNDDYEYTSTGVTVRDYDDCNPRKFTFEQLEDPRKALLIILEKEEELRKIAIESAKARKLQREKDLKALKDAEELAEYTRLRAKFEHGNA
jgi:hypothetical protein